MPGTRTIGVLLLLLLTSDCAERHGQSSSSQSASATARQVRNKNRFDELKALGATEVIDVTTEDVPARVKEITGAFSGCPQCGRIVTVAQPCGSFLRVRQHAVSTCSA